MSDTSIPTQAYNRDTVERVAAAIYAADPLSFSKLSWRERPDREREPWRRMAVAALNAMVA
jgi:hypothetical protein